MSRAFFCLIVRYLREVKTCSCFRVVIRRTDQSRPPDQIRLHGDFCSLVEEGGCRVIISVTVFHCYQWVACRDMMVTATRGAATLVMTAAIPSTLHFSEMLVGVVLCISPLLPMLTMNVWSILLPRCPLSQKSNDLLLLPGCDSSPRPVQTT